MPVQIDGDRGIKVKKLLDPMPPASALEQVKKHALADPAIVGRLLGRQGRHTVIAARTYQMRDEDMEKVAHELAEALGPLNTRDFKIQVTGQPAINAALNKIVLQDTATLTYSGLSNAANAHPSLPASHWCCGPCHRGCARSSSGRGLYGSDQLRNDDLVSNPAFFPCW